MTTINNMNKFLKILNLKPFYRYTTTTSTTSTMSTTLNFSNNIDSLSELLNNTSCTTQDTLIMTLPVPIVDFDYKTCYICYDQIITNSYLRKLNCQHEFHKKCIDKWLFTQFKQSKNEFTCPLCRTGVSPPR